MKRESNVTGVLEFYVSFNLYDSSLNTQNDSQRVSIKNLFNLSIKKKRIDLYFCLLQLVAVVWDTMYIVFYQFQAERVQHKFLK